MIDVKAAQRAWENEDIEMPSRKTDRADRERRKSRA